MNISAKGWCLSTILVVVREDASDFVLHLLWASRLMPLARPGRTNGVFRLIKRERTPVPLFLSFCGQVASLHPASSESDQIEEAVGNHGRNNRLFPEHGACSILLRNHRSSRELIREGKDA